MLTPRQAAAELGVSVSLVYGWVESRQLAHYRVGTKGRRGAIRIAKADLDAFIEALKVPAAAEQIRQVPPAPKRKIKLEHLQLPG